MAVPAAAAAAGDPLPGTLDLGAKTQVFAHKFPVSAALLANGAKFSSFMTTKELEQTVGHMPLLVFKDTDSDSKRFWVCASEIMHICGCGNAKVPALVKKAVANCNLLPSQFAEGMLRQEKKRSIFFRSDGLRSVVACIREQFGEARGKVRLVKDGCDWIAEHMCGGD